MAYLQLTKGYRTQIDERDVAWASLFRWQALVQQKAGRRTRVRAVRHRPGSGLGGPIDYLHRVILEMIPGDGLDVHHINDDELDNRRENLLACPRTYHTQLDGRAHHEAIPSRFVGSTSTRSG